MKPFRSVNQAIQWANGNTPSPRWVDVVVRIGLDWYRLRTTQITNPAKLVTRAKQVYSREYREFVRAFTENKHGELA